MSKIEAFWENATADDVARVMAGETVQARFRGSEKDEWKIEVIAGWGNFNERDGLPLVTRRGLCYRYCCYRYCQVYREPSWWTNRPDPGPECRLLGKFPDEELKPGDECFASTGAWDQSFSATIGERQSYGMWYRRRIEPVEPKFAVGQMVRVVGPKQIPALEWSSVGMAQYAGTTHTVKRIELLTNPPGIYYHLGEIDNWAFREDYLEAVEAVEPDVLHYVLLVGESAKLPNGQTITITEKGFEVTQ